MSVACPSATEVPYVHALSYRDLEFSKVAVMRRSTQGVPYVKWVEVGVPAIPQSVLDTVVYLYADAEAAKAGQNFGGTGFLVCVPSKTHPAYMHWYVVTNYHVSPEGGCSVVRLNCFDGSTDAIEIDPSDWQFTPGAGDLAVASIPVNPGVHRVAFCPMGIFLRQEQVVTGHIGPGDDVFMAGRFIDHDGGQTNQPAVRFGNISVNPTHLPARPNSGQATEYFCLDMHSRTGFSGSPVFAYRTPGSNLNDVFSRSVNLQAPVLVLLGVHSGQFPEDLRIKGEDKVLKGYSGMTYALPAWHIRELLDHTQFVASRALIDAQWEGVNFPCPERQPRGKPRRRS